MDKDTGCTMQDTGYKMHVSKSQALNSKQIQISNVLNNPSPHPSPQRGEGKAFDCDSTFDVGRWMFDVHCKILTSVS